MVWRPVSQHELRAYDETGQPVIVDKRSGVRRAVVPDGVSIGNDLQLTVAMDSGAVGRAAANFAKNKLQHNIFVVYDKVHRLIRDIKLACERAGQTDRKYKAARFVWHCCFRRSGIGIPSLTRRRNARSGPGNEVKLASAEFQS